MTTVAAATSTPASSTTSSASNSGQLNSTQFLSILTTELQNQDPLDPTDPSQFTSQLMSYESVSQQIDMNSSLSTISTNMSSLLTQVSLLTAAAPSANS